MINIELSIGINISTQGLRTIGGIIEVIRLRVRRRLGWDRHNSILNFWIICGNT
jgi:hypothetical protein